MPAETSRRLRLASAAALALLAGAPAARGMDLFEGHAIVTGTGPASLAEALPLALRDVLVKVSGNPALADDPGLEAIDPAPLVEDYVFLDRLTDIPLRDEQGTRDRPWDLFAHFNPDGIRSTLVRLGATAWPDPRPRLLARIEVRDRDGAVFPLSADTHEDEHHRRALLAAADRYGLRVALPPRARPDLDMPGTVPLAGTLAWSETELGWVGAWRMDWQGRPYAWRIAVVSFDAAFRDAMAGAMAVASGSARK
jgi:hypothetical protein